MRLRPSATLGLALAALVLAGCGGGDDAGGSGGAGSSGGGESPSADAGSGGGDKELCGKPTSEWQLGLRDVARADPSDQAAYDATLDQAVEDTTALAGQAQDADLKAAYTTVATGLEDLKEKVSSGAIDTSNPAMMLRAGADAVAGQADVAEACLALGAA
ncbi:hypothetical protein [Nocardioides aurantiacus]|uniref:Lipoprotein n=1 Tax=Nocardioides aurantiacus TaxID=86796 RepID=A0A3N2CP28_9ACTN|nr:hypothetical protein [Nocardioides aurantiacus]ROR89273.1 hypothetical protein EDD33_0090 [Nocardioides aurantiacus]